MVHIVKYFPMEVKFKRLAVLSKLSRVIAVIMVSAILATSSLVLNIGVAEGTHDSFASASALRLTGEFSCPVGRIGTHQLSGSFQASTNPNLFPPGYGRVSFFAPSGGFPLLFDNIDNAPSISSSTFTLSGTLQPGVSGAYCGITTPDGKIYDYTISGQCSNEQVVTVNVKVSSRGETPTVGEGTLTGNVVCHPAAASNQPPTASAGADQTVKEGSIVTLDASASTDSNGDTLTYSWAQTAGTDVTLSDNSAAKPTFTAPTISTTQEILSFELTVNDGKGGTSKDSVTIVVEDDAPIASLTANPTTLDEGQSSELDASGSSSGVGISRYEFTQIAGTTLGTITQDNTNPARATFTAPQVVADEIATIQVTITDNDGDISTATTDITVTNVNQAPLAELTANPTTLDEGETSALDASGSSDPDGGGSLTYSFTILDNGLGTIRDQTDATDPTATYEAPSDVSNDQTVTIQVEVNDGNGGTDTETAQILVKDIPPPPPLTEQFRNQGQCVRHANANPDLGITRQDCQEAFVDEEEEIEEPEVALEEEEQPAADEEASTEDTDTDNTLTEAQSQEPLEESGEDTAEEDTSEDTP